jgi:hypothetical protein
VVKLVDAGDSKSPDSCSHVGSIPTSGTNRKKYLDIYCLPAFCVFACLIGCFVPL